ncbi:unnamed protein product [Prorocentrum cordatum]|uniref:Altered inheritance of mitochondria protein 24, mitochondrial n=1 Tax=Prorocentrum cordatum TaxID=2364126 RepID=A0ABN9WQE1_9DINO|nr:unnamed protein product [Polarella glacialis]
MPAQLGRVLFAALFGAAVRAGRAPTSGSPVAPHAAARAQSFVRPLAFTHRLRVCNAYPSGTAVEAGPGIWLTAADGPMRYETCRDFDPPLKAGDKLEVKVGEITTGTFAVSDLPANDAVMLLVVQRHDSLSTAVAFESHVFAASEGPQVAIIDTYKGTGHAKTLIKDVGKQPRSEELRYNSVVAVSPGRYQWRLPASEDGASLRSGELVALDRESYVLLRTGVEGVLLYASSCDLNMECDKRAARALRVRAIIAERAVSTSVLWSFPPLPAAKPFLFPLACSLSSVVPLRFHCPG